MAKKKSQQVGSIGIRKLSNTYWTGAGVDLEMLGYVEELPRKRRQPRKYRILKPLPALVTFDGEVRDHYTRKLSDWLEAVHAEVESLKGEMEEWRSNLQDGNLDSTEKYQEVESAEDELSYAIDEFDFDYAASHPKLADIMVAVSPNRLYATCSHRSKRKRTGRSWRASECAEILAASIIAVECAEMKEEADFEQSMADLAALLDAIDFPSAW